MLETLLHEGDAFVMTEAAVFRLIGGPDATNELVLLDLASYRST